MRQYELNSGYYFAHPNWISNNLEMMDNNTHVWYDLFLQALAQKYPQKSQLTQKLVDLLCIEPESVYRRLRKEVTFHAAEIAKIASAWNISLDEIININSGKVFFQLHRINYRNPSDHDEQLMQKRTEHMLRISKSPETNYLETCNRIPIPFLFNCDWLNQFYIFKWVHQNKDSESRILFSEIVVSEKMRQITAGYIRATRQMPHSTFMLDNHLMAHLIADIKYFHSIRLITDTEKESLKKDLYGWLDYIAKITYAGYYPETKNKVDFYVSQVSIDTNLFCLCAKDEPKCYISLFDKYEVDTSSPEILTQVKIWMQFKKRTSIMLTEVDETFQIHYFDTQRKIVDGL